MTKRLSITKAVRQKCLECCSGRHKCIRYCPSDGVHSPPCPLWPFRFGLRPETVRNRLGPALLDPGAMPDANVNLDDLP
jgi:hypothetical protein